jgi:uncharacterized protein YndB with AHSA1/START domain
VDDALVSSDREIVTTRVLDAPRERVFEAFRDPERLARWWGPAGFTNTFQEFDLRPGGEWRFVMHGPNGADYPNHSVIVEVVRPERIVFDHVSRPQFRMTITLAEPAANQTQITWSMGFATAAECDRIRAFAEGANEQNLDRLAAELTRMTDPIVRHPLLTASLEGGKNVDRVEIKRVTLAGHQNTGLHLHPCPTVGHVTEGVILFQVEGQPARELSAGDAFYEPANVRMLHFDNPRAEPATFIVYYLLGAGEHDLIRLLDEP